ncbi:MAG: NADH-quinone oxidoreductase subunit M [candidate division Zixibacteria bacterium]|nr:NADH-quinone oxidoreductase subunit M [candidate division Zixibacteria bacterium]
MYSEGFPILSLITFIPLIGVLLILLVDKERLLTIRLIALFTTIVGFIVSLPLFFIHDSGTADFQFMEMVEWVPYLGISYNMGIDGISMLMVILTTFLTPLAIWASFSSITDRVKGYMISFLFLETGMLGVFVSLDLILFFVFWEAMLFPMYFIIGIWGGPKRIYATVKFVLFTMAGSALMLIAIIYLYFLNYEYTGVFTFSLLELIKLPIAVNVQLWMFGAFALAFAIKVPMFPFHTWLPDAHVEAPTAGSVILAAVLLKMGTYGFLRFCLPLFPQAVYEYVPIISILAIIGIIYGAMVAMVQKDIKSLVAYSSVSHLGFVMLGIFALNMQGIEGGILQMINHGISTGALFLLVGMIYERRHTRMIADFGGLAKVIPVFAVFFMIITLSSIGLPGTNGFVGEFLILLGTFKSNIVYAVFASTGVILAAVYMLWMYQRVVFGKVTNKENENIKDLNTRERLILIPLVVLVFFIGFYPKPFLSRMDKSVENLLDIVHRKYRVEQLVPDKRSDIQALIADSETEKQRCENE